MERRTRELLLIAIMAGTGLVCAAQYERVCEKREKNERVEEITQAIREINQTVRAAL